MCIRDSLWGGSDCSVTISVFSMMTSCTGSIFGSGTITGSATGSSFTSGSFTSGLYSSGAGAAVATDVYKRQAQTRKLMEVCRMRKTPVIVFVNKMDRDGKDPFDLLDEIEEELQIKVRPLSWPIDMGQRFKGGYNIYEQKLDLYTPSKQYVTEKIEFNDINSPELEKHIGDTLAEKLRADIELIEGVYPEFDVDTYLKGDIAPVFFGSALNNFGVKELLDCFCLLYTSRSATVNTGLWQSRKRFVVCCHSGNYFLEPV